MEKGLNRGLAFAWPCGPKPYPSSYTKGKHQRCRTFVKVQITKPESPKPRTHIAHPKFPRPATARAATYAPVLALSRCIEGAGLFIIKGKLSI